MTNFANQDPNVSQTTSILGIQVGPISKVCERMSDLMDYLAVSQRNVAALADPRMLQMAARKVEAFATARGMTQLVAASPYADVIVGAALVMLAHKSGQNSAVADDTVLVVDINLGSGTALAEAARRARQQGARHVEGVVLHSLTDRIGPEECGLEQLEVLGLPTSEKTDRQLDH